jgi:cysteine synthase B
MGTTGTIIGTSSYLKKKNPAIQIVGAQPSDGSQIPELENGHRIYQKYLMLIKLIESLKFQKKKQSHDQTFGARRNFAGMSSGGSVATAVKIAEELDSGVIVAIICDRGDRYYLRFIRL